MPLRASVRRPLVQLRNLRLVVNIYRMIESAILDEYFEV